jgi:YidC/Oxa1 family membrane protein insertase
MSPHLAIALSEIFAIAGMIVFFLCFLPRVAFASGAGTRLAPAPVAGYHLLSPTETKALAQDRRNSHNPLYKVIDILVKATGRHRYSYPLALFLISLIVRLALLPLSIRQFRVAQTMKSMEPEVLRLQEQYKADPKKLAEATSALYKKHGINPRLAILFAIAQGAVFMSLYYMVALYQYQFTHGGFLWIGSALAHSYPRWVAASLANPDLPLLALYGLSMCLLPWVFNNTNQADSCLPKANALISAIFFSGFIWMRHTPSAFVLYWLISNCLTLLTQTWIAQRMKSDQPPKAIV